jgi:acetyl esterase
MTDMTDRPSELFAADELHPQVAAFLAEAEASGEPPLYELSPADARAQVDQIIDEIGPGPELANVSEVRIDLGEGSIPGRVYEPGGADAELVWFHGGGWVLAGLDTHDAMCRMLANASGCRITSVDYRLSPEHRYPIPLEDCWGALRWVAARSEGRPVIVGGDSAGGNLAAVCALRARDRGGPALAAQVLIYPVTDCTMDTASYAEQGGDHSFLSRTEMEWFFGHYEPDPAQRRSPDISPLRATDFSELPAAICLTAGHDPLRDEGVAYAQRLRAAGVAVDHLHYPDMIHSFFSFVNVFDRGDEAVADVGRLVRSHLTGSSHLS